MNSLKESKTWKLIKKPQNRRTVKSKWVFAIKYKSNGTIEKFKARLGAKGFT